MNFKEVGSPYDSYIKLYANAKRTVAQLEYASLIGSFMYGMHYTHPDIAFVRASYPDIQINLILHIVKQSIEILVILKKL